MKCAEFRIGDRVQVPIGWRFRWPKKTRKAVVIGFGRREDLVRVRFDGCVSPETWNKEFLELVPEHDQ